MSNLTFNAQETELADATNLARIITSADNAKASFAQAKTAADIKSQICKVWSEISPFLKLAGNIPIVGKYINILADLLDALCKS